MAVATTADDDSLTDDALISKLENSDFSNIYSRFSSYLRPFTDITNPKPIKKPSRSRTAANATVVNDVTTIRSLAKRFLTFLNKSLSLIPKRLLDDPKPEVKAIGELLNAYELCLKCLEAVSSQLSCKPWFVYAQRARMMHCLEGCGRYVVAEEEGFALLGKIGGLDGVVKLKGRDVSRRRVPELGSGGVDSELLMLVVDIVVTVVKCVCLSESKEEGSYRRVLQLVCQSRMWFRALDETAREKLHRALVIYLSKCAIYLVERVPEFNEDFVYSFFSMTLVEYGRSSIKEQTSKFARRICSSVLSQIQGGSSFIVDILHCVLQSVAADLKVDKENSAAEFLEIVSCISSRCRNVCAVLNASIAACINDIAGNQIQDCAVLSLILKIFCIGLPYNRDFLSSLKDQPKFVTLLHADGNLKQLQAVLLSFRGLFRNASQQSCSMFAWLNRLNVPESMYYDALSYICYPWAELVNSNKKHILAEEEGGICSANLCVIQDACLILCEAFLFLQRRTIPTEDKRDEPDDNTKSVLKVAVAALIISFRTMTKIEESTSVSEKMISDGCLRPPGLKYLYVSFYNIGVTMYRSKQLRLASKSLYLCCRSSWSCIALLCHMFVRNSYSFSNEISEEDVMNFVTDACVKSAFFLDVAHQCSSHDLDQELTYCLENWSVVGASFSSVSAPIALVKEWVKINCKIYKEMSTSEEVPTLSCLLLSSSVEKKTTAVLLEQELLEYEEISARSPTLCHVMQMKIINILLNNVYTMHTSSHQRSNLLMKKGKLLRICDNGTLEESIQCLSEAINAINHSHDDRSKWTVRDKHQLAVAYCLRAFSIHEVDPSSEKVLQDVEAAMHLWLSLYEYSGTDSSCLYVSQTAIPLLCHVLDLLSLKVHTSFHNNLYKLLLRFFKWRNIPAATYLPMLWESRRLSHALCPLSVNQDFMYHLAEDVGDKCNSVEYWINCLKETSTLLLGFEQKLSYAPALRRASCCSASSFGRNFTVVEVKEAARNLTSNVAFRSSSLFLAAHLYHDLSERLVYSGKLIEGLSYAKEAHRLRSKLLQERFIYTIKQKNEADHGVVDVERQDYSLKNFSIMKSVACEIWSFDKVSFDLERYMLSPWSVLQCYVESTLQVGVIHEMLGNSIDAEILLKWGINICSSQGLTFPMVAFSCVLGKLYRKKKLWDLAGSTLEMGKNVLSDCMIHVTCLKCKLLYEIDLDLQLGNLFRSQFNSSVGYTSSDQVIMAEKQYKTGLHKLKLPEWRNSVSCPRELSEGRTKTSNGKPAKLELNACSVSLEKIPAKLEPKRAKRTKETPRNLHPPKISIAQKNVRVTRSRTRSSQISDPSEQDNDLNANFSFSNVNGEHASVDTLSQELLFLNIRDSTFLSSCAMCLSERMKCWQCLSVEVHESGLVDNFVFLKWELLRQRFSLKFLMKIGKCLLSRGQIHGAHEVYSESIAVLRIGNHLQYTFSATTCDAWFDPRDEGTCEDALAVERALVIYNVCLHSVMTYHTRNTRDACCDAFRIEFPRILSWLKLAFVLSREVPNLFRKISRLLASLYVVSSATDVFSSPPSSLKPLSHSYWAAYFHQASVGSHFNYHILSSLAGKLISENPSDNKVANKTSAVAEKWDILRLAPEPTQSLDDFVLGFYQGLPSAAVLCLSLLGGTLGSVLMKLLGHPPTVNAWTLLSRFNSVNQPVVILRPVDSILDDDDSSNSVIRNLFGDDDKDWHCPWGSSIIDSVVPLFRGLLKENYLSSSNFPLEDTKDSRSLWWARRKKLDQSLDMLLRDLEHNWFGALKYLFLGGWSDCKCLNSAIRKLNRDLKRKFNVDINPNLLKVYLRGARHAFEMGESFSRLSLKDGCFTKQARNSEEMDEATFSTSDFFESLPSAAVELILEAANELENQPNLHKEPIILVLDLGVQMLPLENMPILRNEEVYRMPSVGSIAVTLDRSRIRQEEIKGLAPFPLMDPLDAFYLLNPSGDLSSTQQEFEKWFKDQNLEGKAGDAPSVDELFSALKKHDLFIYFGHGSGSQYIPGHEIQKLESCAATLLMGCSSGCLHLNGSYLPRGAPLSYLMAGSPAIIANLWEVTDKDIDRFGKAILDAWLIERWKSHSDSEERPKIGSFMSKAREACNLPYLIGAAPVCYGVPTGIWRKKND